MDYATADRVRKYAQDTMACELWAESFPDLDWDEAVERARMMLYEAGVWA